MTRFAIIADEQHWLITQKPAGWTTHATDENKIGWSEYLEHLIGQKLYVVHRLDRDTSGLLILAKSSDYAAKLAALFQQFTVEKSYLCMTSKVDPARIQKKSIVHSSMIDSKKITSNTTSVQVNSTTEFIYINELKDKNKKYFLFEAKPKTGKTHQIRLHAQDLGMPLVGDNDHNGEPYPMLALHSWKLRFQLDGVVYNYEAPTPPWANDPNPFEASVKTALLEREFFYETKDEQECIRWIHHEIPNICIDQYGKIIWFYWFQEQQDIPAELKKYFQDLATKKNKEIIFQQMKNRGDSLNIKTNTPLEEKVWIATENNLRFELRTNQGLSPGLFLDQRENRKWVLKNSANKRVLNLFSYTGGFSVAAAKGTAHEVTTVDVSKTFIEWSKKNFELNSFNVSTNKQFEFWVQDVKLFLSGAVKRGRQWDLIICDPPTIGRSKEGLFSIEKDFDSLFSLLLKVCARNGSILFCTNFEKWNFETLTNKIQHTIKKEKYKFRQLTRPIPTFGFESPSQNSKMKTVLIEDVEDNS